MVGTRVLTLSTAAALASACGNISDTDDGDLVPVEIGELDGSGKVFDPTHIVEVEIELAPADWDELRGQTRSFIDVLLGDCTAQPFPSPFTYFPATVAVDGYELPYDVGVRKKGFIGSLSDVKPSLKVDFDEYTAGQEYLGIDRLTLNNQRQDPGYLNACMGYQILADAGVPAPRCNFAHVTVNGQDLGLYANVETVSSKDHLRRQFDDPDGNLYEGTLSDFRVDWRGTFDRKNNESDPDQSDVDAMVAAVEDASDAALLDELDPLLDVDAYINFWASEVFVGHWDGYASNRNNFFLYRDPATDKFQFMPWGMDAVLNGAQPFGGETTSVVANGHLARRLYLLPETRGQYIARMLELADAWDEDALLAEVDRMEALVADIVEATDGLAAFDEAHAAMREFIRNRADQVRAELSGAPPAWTAPVQDPPCMEPIGTLDGTFDTTWGTLGAADPFASGTGTLSVFYRGNPVALDPIGAVSGPGEQPGEAVIAMIGLLGDGTAGVVYVSLPIQGVAPGASFDIDWAGTFGALYQFPGGGADPVLLGYLAGGTLTLQQAGTFSGTPVVGRIDGADIVTPPFAAQRLPGGRALPDPAALTDALRELR
jgi:spore coat protein CotH